MRYTTAETRYYLEYLPPFFLGDVEKDMTYRDLARLACTAYSTAGYKGVQLDNVLTILEERHEELQQGDQAEQAGHDKQDAGKPQMAHVIHGFPEALAALAGAFTAGYEKYGNDAIRPGDVPNGFKRYSHALIRHMAKEGAEGLKWDEETGQMHAVAVAFNAMARLEALITSTKQDGSEA